MSQKTLGYVLAVVNSLKMCADILLFFKFGQKFSLNGEDINICPISLTTLDISTEKIAIFAGFVFGFLGVLISYQITKGIKKLITLWTIFQPISIIFQMWLAFIIYNLSDQLNGFKPVVIVYFAIDVLISTLAFLSTCVEQQFTVVECPPPSYDEVMARDNQTNQSEAPTNC